VAGSTFNWNGARVPGDVYTDFWRAGEIDDPHYGRNGMRAKWAMEREWWYRRTFEVPLSQRGKTFRLIFDGVDYSCDVWLNGKKLGGHEGMGSRFEFDVTSLLYFGDKAGQNGLVVRLNPPPRMYREVAGRKFAWHGDYWRTLTPMGIWQPVRLVATGPMHIADVYPTSTLRPDGSATVRVQVTVAGRAGGPGAAGLRAVLRGSNFDGPTYEANAAVGSIGADHGATLEIDVPDARLWWPWDLGTPNLYSIETTLMGPDGEPWDETTTRFGIREIRMERNPGFTEDEVQYPWTMRINGKREFLRSASWGGPPDIFYGRNNPDRYRRLVELAREANINNLRIFGWHPTEVETFYDLCDELGLTVWQDLIPLASVDLPEDAAFREATYAEAIAVLKRLRPHPSVVLLEGGEESFYGKQGLEYNARFLVGLGEAIRPHTALPYVPTSPLNWPPILHELRLGKPKDSAHTHKIYYSIGAVLMEDEVPKWDYAVIPEFGVTSCPNVESIRRFIPPDEVWPPGPSWGYHWADLDILRSLNFQVFGDERTGSLEDFVAATQIAQGTIFQYGIEHQRRRKPKSSAISICHLMTFAPDFKWGIVDYFGTPKRSFDFVRRAYQPLLVSMQFDRRRWRPGEPFAGKLWIVNDLPRGFMGCTLKTAIRDSRGEVVQRGSRPIAVVAADSAAPVGEIGWKVAGDIGETFRVELALEGPQGEALSANHYDLRIGDQDKARQDCAELATKFRAIKERYQRSDYYRFYPGLGGPEAASRIGDEPCPWDLSSTDWKRP
jgi:beta-mannosidase